MKFYMIKEWKFDETDIPFILATNLTWSEAIDYVDELDCIQDRYVVIENM